MKVLVIGSVYPRFQEDAEVPWLRTSIAHLKKAGVEIQVLAPAYKGKSGCRNSSACACVQGTQES